MLQTSYLSGFFDWPRKAPARTSPTCSTSPSRRSTGTCA
nr:hypothetical protein [Halomicroarcula sp. SYNS111]